MREKIKIKMWEKVKNSQVNKRKFLYRQSVLLFCLFSALGLCACSIGGDSSDVIEKYEDECEFMGINMNLENRVEYVAEESGDKLCGYPATLSIKRSESVPEKDLAEIACEYLASYIINSNADIAECTVSILSGTETEEKLTLRFTDFSREHIDVYFEGTQETYQIDREWPEDLLLYTETTAERCEYTLPGEKEAIQGTSVTQEISLLRDTSEEELEKILTSHILQEQEDGDDEELSRVEYRFIIYGRGEEKQTIEMRYADSSGKDWKIVS